MCGNTTALLQAAMLAPEDNQGMEELEEMHKRLQQANLQDSIVVGGLTVPWWFVEWNHEPEAAADDDLEETRQSVRQMFKSALSDGRLHAAMENLHKGREEPDRIESIRNRARSAFLTGIEEDRLEAAFQGYQPSPLDACFSKVMDNVTKARDDFNASLEETGPMSRTCLRTMAKHTLTNAVADGRLMSAVATLKKEKEAQQLEEMRQSAHTTFKQAMDDGRLTEVMASLKRRKEVEELETMRQSVRKTLYSSLQNGRLSQVVEAMQAEKQAKELEAMRQGMQKTLQSSLLDGRLAQVVTAMKAEKQVKEVEATRKQVMTTLQTSIENGRLSEVIAQIKQEKAERAAAAAAKQQAVSTVCSEAAAGPTVAQDARTGPPQLVSPKPVRPSSSKTTARPSRRSSARSAVAEEERSLSAESEDKVVNLCDVLKTFMQTHVEVDEDADEEAQETSQQSSPLDMSLRPPRLPTPTSGLRLAPPASPTGALPPVAPPSRQRCETMPRPSSRSAMPTAMSLDLDLGSSTPVARPGSSSKKTFSVPSAMSLDLGDSSSTKALRPRSSSQKPFPTQTAISFDLGSPWASMDLGKVQRESQSRSLSNLRMSKTSSKQTPGFLPPISGSSSKASSHKRSSSMDSFVWGVAPLVASHVEWGNSNKLVF